MAAPKKTKPQDIENQTVLAKAQAVDIPTVVKEIGDLQIQIQAALSGLGASLTSKVQSFTDLDKAVALTEQRLTELHGIEDELLSLESIKALRAEERDSSQKERDERSAQWDEEETDRDKQWQREEEEHAYNTKVQQQRALDEFNSDIERNKRAEAIRQEILDRQHADREAALKSQENEVKALRDQAATFEARVKNEVTRAEAILKNSMEREHRHTLALIAKETETSTRLHEGQVVSLQATVDQLRAQVADLNTQLVAARTDAKDVATQALQSAAGRQTADALLRVVDTQSNNGKK